LIVDDFHHKATSLLQQAQSNWSELKKKRNELKEKSWKQKTLSISEEGSTCFHVPDHSPDRYQEWFSTNNLYP